ncbi:MAG: type II toxin-antitoxin system VapC family toxin [Pseudomonadota bacterium]
MRLLLDTHILLWALLNDPRLSAKQVKAISEGELYVSAASIWEIGIKRALGKLNVPDDLFDVAEEAGCRQLPISWLHAETAAKLPQHHADPFDRMLIAQAGCEGLTLASADRQFAQYEVELIT